MVDNELGCEVKGGELQLQPMIVFILTFCKCTPMCMRRYTCNDILYTCLAFSILILTITYFPSSSHDVL